jgi:hypothetical protein
VVTTSGKENAKSEGGTKHKLAKTMLNFSAAEKG